MYYRNETLKEDAVNQIWDIYLGTSVKRERDIAPEGTHEESRSINLITKFENIKLLYLNFCFFLVYF